MAWRAKVSTESVNLISASASASGSMPALICGDRIFARLEAVGIDAGEIGGRGLGALVHRAVGDPERREIAAGIERLDGGALFLAAEDAVEFAGGELFAKLVDHRGVGERPW